mgnify:CR=1 FL=1
MWELKLSQILSLIIILILVGIGRDIWKSNKSGKARLNDKSLGQRIREYNIRWRDKYE